MNYARVINGIVFEIISVPANIRIEDMFPPDVVATCVLCEDTVDQMWRYEEGTFLPPEQPALPTQGYLAASVRYERDRRIESTLWIIQRHEGQLNLGIETTILEAEYLAWLAYHQALRDLPTQEGFPWQGGGKDDSTCPWPVQPS